MNITMKKKYNLIGLLVFFLWISVSFAQDASLKEAKKLFEKNKIKEATNLFLEIAKTENAEAFYYLGRML